MPAETHRRRDAVDLVSDVIDLFEALLDEPMGVGGIRAETRLADLGVDDLAVLHLWDAAVEELAERGSADVDVDELLLARTVGELADLIVRSTGTSEPPDWCTNPVTDARSADR
jgi:hypothetical protein